ncbi:hypothetical protein [Haemophilus haemolyticus]|uniref:hypothetical protein n=1 Tax=Haemophilus haemolyticus TaxID=726 RepID=UPI00112DB644|nr:hypothetical protein [Haemophilus haemolyticus]TPH24126.1 hypothetical protein EUX56_08810 [Haemophilus haemolyticus]
MEKLNKIAADYRTFADLLDNLVDLEAAINDEINKANQQKRKLFDTDGLGHYCDERDHKIQANLQGKAERLSDNYGKIKDSRVMSGEVGKTLVNYDSVFVHEHDNKSGYPQVKSLLEKLSGDINKLKDLL